MTHFFSHARRTSFLNAFVLLSLGAYGFHLILAILVDRALYADGSFFFVENISSLGYPLKDDEKHIRLFVNVINQIPLSFGRLLGVENLDFLRILFGLGLFFVPAAFYCWCFVLASRAKDFSILYCAILSLVVFVIPSEIFILNQSITTLAICWVLAHYAMLPLKIKRLESLFVVLLCVSIFRAHESMIIWGWALCFSAFAGMRRENCFQMNEPNWRRYFIGIAGVSSSLFVLWWQLTHPVGQQTDAYLNLFTLLKPEELLHGNTRISFITLISIGLIWVSYRLKGCPVSVGKLLRLAAILAGVYVTFFAFSAVRFPDLANPFREYEYRFLITFGAGVVLLFAPYVRMIGGGLKMDHAAVFVLAAGLLGATIWQVSNDWKWDAFRRASIRALAYSEDIVVSPEAVSNKLQSVGQSHLYRYRWDWTWPVFGLSLHESPVVLRIFKPEGFEQYFALPRTDGDAVRVPFMSLGDHGFFDFSPLKNACSSGLCP